MYIILKTEKEKDCFPRVQTFTESYHLFS